MPESQILRETRASTTWENVSFTLPLLGSTERIAFASDPLHAARARRYLSVQRPDLASRLVAADDYRFGEHPFIKLGSAGYEALLAARRRMSSAFEHDRAKEPA